MIPYGKHEIRERDVESVVKALNSDRITQGDQIRKFEKELCQEFDCNHAVALNSGTMALRLAYQALGVNKDKKVLTSPNTFAATANTIVHNDGQPEFIDIDPETFNIDTTVLKDFLCKSKNRAKTVGIAPVHFAGLPSDLESIYNLARDHDMFVLEDACHAPGAEWRDSDGNRHKIGSCSHSDAAILSFHPVKHFTTGEGGAVLTNSEDLADTIRDLRHHGIQNVSEESPDSDGPWYYEMKKLGSNGRITDFQAALGRSQLDRLDEYLRRRREIAVQYDRAFENIESISTQRNSDTKAHAYHLYVIQHPNRKELYNHLQEHDIAPQVHYIPVPQHPYYQNNYNIDEASYKEAKSYYETALSLPMYPTLSDDKVNYVIDVIEKFIQNKNNT